MNKNDQNLDIRTAVMTEIRAEQALLKVDDKDNDEGITPKFVYDCLMANEFGDGTLFAKINLELYLYNKSSAQWYRWTGHSWESDYLESVFGDVESVVERYQKEVSRLSMQSNGALSNGEEGRAAEIKKTKSNYLKRIKRLRSIAGAHNCLTWSHKVKNGLGIRGEKLDCQPLLLACSNGVLELKIGRFRAGRPDDYLTRAVPHAWVDIDAPAPTWEKFLEDIFANKSELIAYVQRLFGYAVTGLTTEHILPVLYGDGRNGKSTLIETLRYVLGALAQPIHAEMLLEQRWGRASSGPSPDIMALKALRIAFASETDEGRRFSTSKAKWLSGGDTLTGRNPHDKHETVFEPTHLLCLLTNNLPHAPGDDFAFWQRIHLIPFNVRFVNTPSASNEKPCDKELPKKLRNEAPGILAWLVRGCIEWQRQGLNPPLVVRSATEQYRLNEDLIAEFLSDCCLSKDETGENAREKFKNLYKAFESWYIDTIGDTKYVLQKKKFNTLMEKKFTRNKAGGQIWFHGVLFKAECTPDWT